MKMISGNVNCNTFIRYNDSDDDEKRCAGEDDRIKG
jgi:hypothetical protein